MFKILNVIKTLKNLDDNLPVYLCAHSAPDEDAINSCIGIKTALEYLKKDCYILLDSKDTKILSWQKIRYKQLIRLRIKNTTLSP